MGCSGVGCDDCCDWGDASLYISFVMAMGSPLRTPKHRATAMSLVEQAIINPATKASFVSMDILLSPLRIMSTRVVSDPRMDMKVSMFLAFMVGSLI